MYCLTHGFLLNCTVWTAKLHGTYMPVHSLQNTWYYYSTALNGVLCSFYRTVTTVIVSALVKVLLAVSLCSHRLKQVEPYLDVSLRKDQQQRLPHCSCQYVNSTMPSIFQSFNRYSSSCSTTMQAAEHCSSQTQHIHTNHINKISDLNCPYHTKTSQQSLRKRYFCLF